MRRLIIGALAALAIVGLAGCSATGGAPKRAPVTPSPVATVAPITTTQPPAPRVVRIGSPVRNGSLVFTVQGVRRAKVVYNQFGSGWQAGGEFIIVKVTVQNLGPQPVFFFPGLQTLVVDGYQFAPEAISTSYLNEVTDQIQPGLTITRELSFNMNVGTQPEAIMLSDISLSSTAARVELT